MVLCHNALQRIPQGAMSITSVSLGRFVALQKRCYLHILLTTIASVCSDQNAALPCTRSIAGFTPSCVAEPKFMMTAFSPGCMF